jgi:ribosomal protein S12 methylthiotransferase
MGCLAQKYSRQVKEEMKEVDGIMGIGDLTRITDVIRGGKESVLIPDFASDDLIQRNIIGYPGTAYLRISDGCSNFCSFCSIPHIRGTRRSRKIESILQELEYLLTKNINEVILVSQDTSNYGLDNYGRKMLNELLKKTSEMMNDQQWIRVLYLHPDHIDDDMIETMKGIRQFVPYFDIPFQSGNARILKQMKRQGNRDQYLKLIEKIRSSFQDSVIRSTFIAGFPGETDEEYQDTLDFIKEASLEWVGGFEYSREEGTAASSLEGHLRSHIKKRRLKELLSVTEPITSKLMERFAGTSQKVLIEEKVDESLYLGRFWGQAPDVDGLTVVESYDVKEGQFSQVQIKKINGKDLFAVQSP